mmetsp:Transcript_19922/g.29375  ORF Transcript_19922/g.29375 Transcript_19922/m.29375 type:complete len:114 (+) Transcript_19922:1054-1395(+)
MPTIAQGVEFSCLAREWRCKFSDDDDMASLKAAQRILEEFQLELLEVVKEFAGSRTGSRTVMNGEIDSGKQLVQRVVSSERNDFKAMQSIVVRAFLAYLLCDYNDLCKGFRSD